MQSSEYWENCWKSENLDELQKYLSLYQGFKTAMITVFQENHIRTVCDAACGFGAYSLMLSSNGFIVSGFDVSNTSVNLTKKLLSEYQIDTGTYIQSSITDIGFAKDTFDAAVAHAVLDHLSMKDAKTALCELKRIVKKDGLIAISFDGYCADDFDLPHNILPDGCFQYTDAGRNGMLYHYYTEDEVKQFVANETVCYQEVKSNGERFLIIRNSR